MNKKLHKFLLCLLLIVIIYSCKDKLLKLVEHYSSGIGGSIIEPFFSGTGSTLDLDDGPRLSRYYREGKK